MPDEMRPAARRGLLCRALATAGLATAGLALAACGPPASVQDAPHTSADIASAPATPADLHEAYGPAEAEYGELRLPRGRGPFPVAVLIHGGCWRAEYDAAQLAPMGAELAHAGIASWTVEYRRLGDAGGGWPGTFDDVARGIEHVRELATRFPLDTAHVVLVGHSAGAQLALWAAASARARTASADSTGPSAPTLRVRGVVSLAGITDLHAFAAEDGSCAESVGPLLGGLPDDVAARYAAASPIERLPSGVRVRLIHGGLDAIVPLVQSRAYLARADATGDDARLIVADGLGHFDLILPTSRSWPLVLQAIRELAGVR